MQGKPQTAPARIAVLGAGMMGRRHAEIIAGDPGVRLAGLADPSSAGRDLAATLGTPWHPSLADLLAADRPDGILIATPNTLHAQQALDCIAAGIPVLVEKPIATDPGDARRVVAAAAQAGVPLLVGHHRRHNPIIEAAKSAIDAGRIGRVVAVNALVWLMKPAPYFDAEWRRMPGAGPILTNLIHDIDLLRHFCGDVTTVQAVASSQIRGHAVEDTAAIVVTFASGALGTLSVSDTAVGPWSWELTAAENPDYPATGQSCYMIAGTEGALEVPTLRLWRNPGPTGWHQPLAPETLSAAPQDPLLRQILHFADVIGGTARPLVTGGDGAAALAVLDAIKTAACSGGTVFLEHKALAQ